MTGVETKKVYHLDTTRLSEDRPMLYDLFSLSLIVTLVF